MNFYGDWLQMNDCPSSRWMTLSGVWLPGKWLCKVCDMCDSQINDFVRCVAFLGKWLSPVCNFLRWMLYSGKYLSVILKLWRIQVFQILLWEEHSCLIADWKGVIGLVWTSDHIRYQANLSFFYLNLIQLIRWQENSKNKKTFVRLELNLLIISQQS